MEQLILKISNDFSTTPGPRYINEGDWSGELFRKDFLTGKVKLAIAANKKLLIDLDGTAGYGTSFLEESFGGLIRVEKISYESIKKHLEFKSDEEPYLIIDIEEYIEDAHQKAKNN